MKLKIKNFRSLKDTGNIEIKPITILVGRNSSGKSSFLRTFPMLKQSTEEKTKSPILLYGNYVDFGSYRDIKPHFAIGSDQKYELGFTFGEELVEAFTGRYRFSRQPKITITKDFEIEYCLRFEENEKELIQISDINCTVLNICSLFAEFYIKDKIKNKFNTVYSRRTGGGSTTCDEYKEIFNKDENFCLCILDSDRRTKAKGYGQTALKVFKFHNTHAIKNLKCEYLILPVLEVENLLPENFYKLHYKQKYPSEILPSIRRMEKFDSAVRKYFDYKKGIKGFSLQSDESVILYWWDLTSKAKIKCVDIDDKTYYYVQGFGEHILTDFLSHNSSKIFNLVSDDPVIKKIWLRLGAYISSFIIAGAVERAI
jgi:AAA15 family ATPase/GTPase